MSQLGYLCRRTGRWKGVDRDEPAVRVRVGDASVRNLYAQLGKVGRSTFLGWNVGLLSADPALERQVGIRFDRLFQTSNGGIPVRFILGVSTPPKAIARAKPTK